MVDDNKSGPGQGEIKNSIIIVASVSITFLVAILFTLSDKLQSMEMVSSRPTFGPLQIVEVGGSSAQSLPTHGQSPTPNLREEPAISIPSTPNTNLPSSTPKSQPILAGELCGNWPIGWIPYTVRGEESLNQIAIDSGVTVNELVQANCLQNNLLVSGMIIFVPPFTPEEPPCGPPPSWMRYMVNQGDNLGLLARRHRTTIREIMQGNCLENTTIFAGRFLYLPPITVTTTVPVNTFTPRPIASPSSTPTMLPTKTNTPRPTASSSPKATATSFPTSMPTSTPPMPATATPPQLPSATPPSPPTQTNTPLPADTATNTPQPSSTPMPSETPLPSNTSTNTPVPSGT